MKSPQKKNSHRSCNVGRNAREGLGLANFGTRLQKILANPKPSQPHEPKGNDESNSTNTDFFAVRVREKTRIHALRGLAWATPQILLLPPKTLFCISFFFFMLRPTFAPFRVPTLSTVSTWATTYICFQIYSWSRFWLGFFGTFRLLFLDSMFR